jgi:hypothetical protein
VSSKCAQDGMLVGAELPLIDANGPALTEEDIAAGRIRGCSRIVCSKCDRAVKSFPGRYWESRPTDQQLEEAYDKDDFSPYLGTKDFFKSYRAYACRCDLTLVNNPMSLLDAYQRLELPWACEGHPARR